MFVLDDGPMGNDEISPRCRVFPGGAAFVDTAQLDGESSLKPKQAVDETQHMIRNSSVHSVEGAAALSLTLWRCWNMLEP